MTNFYWGDQICSGVGSLVSLLRSIQFSSSRFTTDDVLVVWRCPCRVMARGVHSSLSQLCIVHIPPYFVKFINFLPYFHQIYWIPPIFFQFTFLSLNLHLFASPLFWSRTWHLWPLSLASAQQCWDWFELKSLRCVMVDIRLCAGNWIQLAWILLLRATYCCTDLEGSVYIHSSKL